MADKDKIVARLEGKDIYDLRDEYYRMEDLIVDILADKKNWNNPCDCEEGDLKSFRYIDDDNTIIQVCMRCGGDLE